MIAEIAVFVGLFAIAVSCFANVACSFNPTPGPVVSRINTATSFVVICAGIVVFPVVFGAHQINAAVDEVISNHGPGSA